MRQIDSANELEGRKCFQQGMDFMQRGNYPEASVEVTKAIGFMPNDPDLYFYQGVISTLLGQYQKALINYNRAIEIDPTDVAPYMNRGNTYDRLGRYPEALTDFNQAIALGRSDASLYFNRGNTNIRLGNHEDALIDYLHAIILDPQRRGNKLSNSSGVGSIGKVQRRLDVLYDCHTVRTSKRRGTFSEYYTRASRIHDVTSITVDSASAPRRYAGARVPRTPGFAALRS